jgi:hypothetical protein
MIIVVPKAWDVICGMARCLTMFAGKMLHSAFAYTDRRRFRVGRCSRGGEDLAADG